MGRLSQDNLVRARALVALYPHKRSALVPVLHVLQEQDGYLSPEGIEDVAALLGLTAAEVRGTASFYDMFHLEPIGRYLVAVCTNIACMLDGAYELLEHVQEDLGVHPGGTTSDGVFTLEEAECLALCGNAPCVTVNWRFFGNMTPHGWDELAADLRAGRLDAEVPPHGTLCRVRRAVGLPAGPTDTGPGAVPGAVPAGDAPKDKAGPPPAVDARGQAVPLETSRTTPAVASTLAVRGPAEDAALPDDEGPSR
jgi:NADH-quinone oxidoreductase E subunit